MPHSNSPLLDPLAMRQAGRELLSLALMDARNHTLRMLSALEQAQARTGLAGLALWHIGHVGWFQEYWLARNLQRERGAWCDPSLPRLASVEPRADQWFSEDGPQWDAARGDPGPDAMAVRDYLAATLDLTLELLESAGPGDDSLYFFRLALLHEDRHAEDLMSWVQALDLGGSQLDELVHGPVPQAPREALLFPATHWQLGQAGPGLVLDYEGGALPVQVPEFEIDAQPVNWAQYTEFIADGGYDSRDCWSEAGWAWVQAEGRRSPRYVDQIGNGVLVRRFGHSTRLTMLQPVMHMTLHEALAWCRWANRRLPTEVEWELAAMQGRSRGFHWGQVQEWTAGGLRLLPGASLAPWRARPPAPAACAVRGASFASAPRMRHAKAREAWSELHDVGFVGFRSCSI
nr:SUMF1/EgtB/PvdO family nonheme iron enzyme [uncultured Roseateles sp.]